MLIRQILNRLPQFLWILKSPPDGPVHAAKCLLEAVGLVLARVGHLGHVDDLADEDGAHPARVGTAHVAVRFRVRLSAVADAEQLAPREPGLEFRHPVALVCLCTLRERREEAAQVHPGGIAEEDGPGWVVFAHEGGEERVQIVGRGREVKPSRIERGRDVLVECWHRFDWGGGRDEGGTKDADRRWRHGNFDCVVDICDERELWGVSMEVLRETR